MRTSDPGHGLCTDVSESVPFCKRAPEALDAFASSNRSIPSSVSKARKPIPVVLSTSGIGDHDAIKRVDVPATQKVHHVQSLLGPPRVDEIALASSLHEHASPCPTSIKMTDKEPEGGGPGPPPEPSVSNSSSTHAGVSRIRKKSGARRRIPGQPGTGLRPPVIPL
jgi:hypothetical protein